MLESIRCCEKCGLCKNQRPILDDAATCSVFWIGLSAKAISFPSEPPLSDATNSGMMVSMAESQLNGLKGYRTNLVKCLPLDKQGKLRYPSTSEIDHCFCNLISELESFSPIIAFMLGSKVTRSIEKHLSIECKKWDGFDYHCTYHEGTYYVPIHHPSYVYVYKRKHLKEYITGIQKAAEHALSLNNADWTKA